MIHICCQLDDLSFLVFDLFWWGAHHFRLTKPAERITSRWRSTWFWPPSVCSEENAATTGHRGSDGGWILNDQGMTSPMRVRSSARFVTIRSSLDNLYDPSRRWSNFFGPGLLLMSSPTVILGRLTQSQTYFTSPDTATTATMCPRGSTTRVFSKNSNWGTQWSVFFFGGFKPFSFCPHHRISSMQDHCIHHSLVKTTLCTVDSRWDKHNYQRQNYASNLMHNLGFSCGTPCTRAGDNFFTLWFLNIEATTKTLNHSGLWAFATTRFQTLPRNSLTTSIFLLVPAMNRHDASLSGSTSRCAGPSGADHHARMATSDFANKNSYVTLSLSLYIICSNVVYIYIWYGYVY